MVVLVRFGEEYINPEHIVAVRSANEGKGTNVSFNATQFYFSGNTTTYSLEWSEITVSEWVNKLQTNPRIVVGEAIVNSGDLR
jgi:hypothetical protein